MSVTIAETRDIATCRALRRIVFIEEQGVSEADEVDDRDDEATHLLATDAGRPVGTARLLTSGSTGKIGRVCVLAESRGTGLGAALIRAGIETFRNRGGIEAVKLGAQVHAQGFYEKLGFAPIGEVYDDAGIPHIDMVTRL
ncbi:MAG: GNAT family N-acetyltransferase [Rhodobacteraceae bacterium]|nr:GNAT family N-acetyltransferase [Paracoccaceae bacterium]